MSNFGWEYVWHCHLLGHEENDMMRPIVFQVAPAAPTNLAAAHTGAAVNLTWTNNATYPAATEVTIQRATNAAFTSGVTTFTAAGTATTYTDTTVTAGTTYYYRVRAENAPGYSAWSEQRVDNGAGDPGDPDQPAGRGHRGRVGPRSINLTWAESAASTVTGFTINWALNAAFTTGAGTGTVTPGAVRQATLTGLARATRYYIRIRADNAGVSSAWAPTVSVYAGQRTTRGRRAAALRGARASRRGSLGGATRLRGASTSASPRRGACSWRDGNRGPN